MTIIQEDDFYTVNVATETITLATDAVGNTVVNYTLYASLSIRNAGVYPNAFIAIASIVPVIAGDPMGGSWTQTQTSQQNSIIYNISRNNIVLPDGDYMLQFWHDLGLQGGNGLIIESDAFTVGQPQSDGFDRAYTYRIPTGRELTWPEGDANTQITEQRTNTNRSRIDEIVAQMTPFSDNFLQIANAIDPTKRVQFSVALPETGQTITLVVPQQGGTILVDGQVADVQFGGNLIVDGDIIQQGGSYVTEVETLAVADQFVVLRRDATVPLPVGQWAGFRIMHYNTAGDVGMIVLGRDGILRIGDEDDEQPVATRENSPINGGIAWWNAAQLKYCTATELSWDGNKLVQETSPQTLTADAIVDIDWTSKRMYDLNINANTTLHMIGSYVVGQIVQIDIAGDFMLHFVQSGVLFRGQIDPDDGLLTSYMGDGPNLVQIQCIAESPTPIFWLANLNIRAYD